MNARWRLRRRRKRGRQPSPLTWAPLLGPVGDTRGYHARSLRAWPGPLRRGAEGALRTRLTTLATNSSSLYAVSDVACLWSLLHLLVESEAGKWATYVCRARIKGTGRSRH